MLHYLLPLCFFSYCVTVVQRFCCCLAAPKGLHNVQSLAVATETVKHSLKAAVEKLYRQYSKFCKLEKETWRGQESLHMEKEEEIKRVRAECERKVSNILRTSLSLHPQPPVLSCQNPGLKLLLTGSYSHIILAVSGRSTEYMSTEYRSTEVRLLKVRKTESPVTLVLQFVVCQIYSQPRERETIL